MFFKKSSEDHMYLGEKRVEIIKLTPNNWKLVFGSIKTLPTVIITVLQAPKHEIAEYLMYAFEMSQAEIIEVVHKLTGVEVAYLNSEVGLDEIVEYVTRVVKKNRLDTLGKNLQSLLGK